MHCHFIPFTACVPSDFKSISRCIFSSPPQHLEFLSYFVSTHHSRTQAEIDTHYKGNHAECYRRNSSTVTLDLVLLNQACCAGLYLHLRRRGLGSFETHLPATSLPHCTVSGRVQLVYDPRSTATWHDKRNIQKNITFQSNLLVVFSFSKPPGFIFFGFGIRQKK